MGFLSELSGNDYGSNWSPSVVKIEDPNPAYLDKTLQLPMLGMRLKAADDAKKAGMLQTPFVKTENLNPQQQKVLTGHIIELNMAANNRRNIAAKLEKESYEKTGRGLTAAELANHPDMVQANNNLQNLSNSPVAGITKSVSTTQTKNQQTTAKHLNDNDEALQEHHIDEANQQEDFSKYEKQLQSMNIPPEEIALRMKDWIQKNTWARHGSEYGTTKFKKRDEILKDVGTSFGDVTNKWSNEGTLQGIGTQSGTDILGTLTSAGERNQNVKQVNAAILKATNMGLDSNALNKSVSDYLNATQGVSLSKFWSNAKQSNKPLVMTNGSETFEIDPNKPGQFDKMVSLFGKQFIPKDMESSLTMNESGYKSLNDFNRSMKQDGETSKYYDLKNFLTTRAMTDLNPHRKEKNVDEIKRDFLTIKNIQATGKEESQLVTNALVDALEGRNLTEHKKLEGSTFVFGKGAKGELKEESVYSSSTTDKKVIEQTTRVAKTQPTMWIRSTKDGKFYNINSNELGDLSKQINDDNFRGFQFRIQTPTVAKDGQLVVQGYKEVNGKMQPFSYGYSPEQWKKVQNSISKPENKDGVMVRPATNIDGKPIYINTTAFAVYETHIGSSNQKIVDRNDNDVDLGTKTRSGKNKEGSSDDYVTTETLVPIIMSQEQKLGSVNEQGKKHHYRQTNPNSSMYVGTEGVMGEESSGVVNIPKKIKKQKHGGYINPNTKDYGDSTIQTKSVIRYRK